MIGSVLDINPGVDNRTSIKTIYFTGSRSTAHLGINHKQYEEQNAAYSQADQLEIEDSRI